MDKKILFFLFTLVLISGCIRKTDNLDSSGKAGEKTENVVLPDENTVPEDVPLTEGISEIDTLTSDLIDPEIDNEISGVDLDNW